MPTIGSRIFAVGGSKKYCSLINDEIIRPLGPAGMVGQDWSAIRIGLLCAIGTDGTNNLTNTTFAIGLCSGSSNGVGAASTTNFLGFRGLIGVNNYTYNANAGNPYFSNGTWYGLWRVNNSDTTFGVGTTNQFFATNTGSTQRKSIIFCDINKLTGAANSYCTPSANMTSDFSYTSLLEGLDYGANSNVTVNNVALTGITGQTFAFNQNSGLLDSVNICWKNALGVPLEIYGFGVWRRF